MKGKIAFAFGLGLGYVLGTRAGRGRYEQIKKAANKVWQTNTVQKLQTKATGFVGDRVQQAQHFVLGKSKQLLHAATSPERDNQGATGAGSAADKGVKER